MKITELITLMVFLFVLQLFAIDTIPGTTLDLDGTYIEVPHDSLLNSDQFTISFWAKVNGNEGIYRSPVTSRSATTGFMFYASDDNHWEFWTRYGTTTSNKIEGPFVVLDEWAYITGTFDGTDMYLYVNGEFAGSLENMIWIFSNPCGHHRRE